MMKKLIALVMALLLPLCAMAEMDEDGVVVSFDSAEVFFIPYECYCLTQESSASQFTRLGLSQREVLAWMEDANVQALLFDEAFETEIHVSIALASGMSDFDDLSVYALDMACESVESMYITQGYDVETVDMCHTINGHSYVQIVASYLYEDGYVTHTRGYFTCQSGYVVSVLLYPFEGAPTEEQIYLCEGIIDSLWLTLNVEE